MSTPRTFLDLFVICIDLEEEIEKLESSSTSDKTRLNELKTELEKINKKKEDYVAEHPEHRKLVFKARRQTGEKDQEPATTVLPQKRNLFNKRGLPRHPERSIYYDPVLNPFGVAPPGMPYMERRESCYQIIILSADLVYQLFGLTRLIVTREVSCYQLRLI